jgi:hypothetical protein
MRSICKQLFGARFRSLYCHSVLLWPFLWDVSCCSLYCWSDTLIDLLNLLRDGTIVQAGRASGLVALLDETITVPRPCAVCQV